MRVVGEIAGEAGIDPARPRVPTFGRRLYNLPIKKLLQRKPDGPVALKARALNAGHVDEPLAETFKESFESWRAAFSKQRFGGIVVDYDGTVCSTGERFELPRESMQSAILRVIEGGLRVGFATGRGRSIHKDLRAWVPAQLWPAIYLGLYNGAIRLKLSETLPDLYTPSALMTEIAERLAGSPFASLMHIEVRAGQVTIQAESDTFFHDLSLARMVRDLLNEEPAIAAKVVSSGHSVDVLAPDTTKVTVLRELEASCGRPVLVIGDQGQSGGNDFELLAATQWSLSVDRCSADPTRCWSIGRSGRRGPAVLEEVLTRLKINNGTARLAVPPEKA
jgi:hydroxymethylpyrimidine pyrophosphatase-like HAD family hydrolase